MKIDVMGVIDGIGDEVLSCLVFILLITFTIWYLFSFHNTYAGNSSTMDMPNFGRIRNPSEAHQDCPICLSNLKFAIETNCGHTFCGSCLLAYHDILSTGLSALNCPFCRQRITVLLPYFSNEERGLSENMSIPQLEERQILIPKIRDYNRRFSGESRSWMEHIRDLPVLARHVWRLFWSEDEGIPLIFRLRILLMALGAVCYALMPLDILPEMVFGIVGLLDDIFIILVFLMYAVQLFRQLIAQNAG